MALQTARLFGPSIFEAAKLKVLLQGAAKKHPEELPRVYTLTHSDVTSKITLAISREINKAQVHYFLLMYLERYSILWLKSCCSGNKQFFLYTLVTFYCSFREVVLDVRSLITKHFNHFEHQLWDFLYFQDLCLRSISVLGQLKGWYSKLQRDEVVAEWRKVQGKMSLHVHCHISGGNVLHNLIANLRFYIFRKELPVVSALHYTL